VEAGVRVDFAAETSVLADMPISYVQATSQNARWEQGRLQLIRQHVPRLVLHGLRRRSAICLDAAAEQFIPPLSVPLVVGTLCLSVSLAIGAKLPATLAAIGLVVLVGHLAGGLLAVRAPVAAYLALSQAPLYALWKVSLYGRALLTSRSTPWIRTARPTPPTEITT
jgi:hypothetical protein